MLATHGNFDETLNLINLHTYSKGEREMLTLVLGQKLRYAEPLKIDRYHINVTINNQLAVTKMKQTFTNPNEFEVSGQYIFPVSDDVALSNFALSVNGEPFTGKLLPHEDSRRIYRSSVRAGHNLGLVDHFGKRVFVADVPNITANSRLNIEFEYSQIISVENDLVKYSHPLSLAKSASGPIADLAINMEIESDHELRTINSVSHELNIERENDHHVHISYEGNDIEPDDDFQCDYSISDDDFGITLLTHRADENEDGYFMLLVSPKYEVKKTDIIEKDFIFVLDHSGSMMGRKIEQAKDALCFCVNNLNEGDRFNLILFNTEITSFADRLNRQEGLFKSEILYHSEAKSDHLIDMRDGRDKAIAFIEGIEAGGGTNINAALLAALSEKPDPNRPRIIVFLTDGCPTVGLRNTEQILKNVAQANENQSRIFVFGVGNDVNKHLLDKLAADNGGTRNHVKPNNDIEVAVSSLFREMNEPVLVNVELDFGQIITKELTPMSLPDMFCETQLMLLGRYEGHGDAVLKLSGAIGSEQQEFSKNVNFAELETGNDHLPQLWAQRRVAELVDQAALNGYSEELRREIERISKEYDVITEDTHFRFAEDGSGERQLQFNIHKAYDPSRPNEEIIERSIRMEERKYARSIRQTDDIRYIGNKAFYRKDRMWVDTKHDEQSERKIVEFGSDAYFDLARQSHDLARCLKLSHSMIICHEGVSYEITLPKKSS